MQQSSLRSWVLSLELIMRALGGLEIDPRDEQVRPYGWWDTMDIHLDEFVEHFPPPLLASLRARLPTVAAMDSPNTWPEPAPLRIATGDRLGGPWMSVLGVAPP